MSRGRNSLFPLLFCFQSDPLVTSIDLGGANFLTDLINVASSVAITAASHTFHNFLYRHCSTGAAKTLSKTERKEKDIKDNSFVYGEIDFHSFSQIIKEIRPLFKPDGIFVDLGSGTGRPVFAMALLSDMKKIYGIEALDGLHNAAQEILTEYETFVESDAVEIELPDEDEEEGEGDGQSSVVDPSIGSPTRLAPPKKKTTIVNSPLAKLERRASRDWTSSHPDDRRIELIHGDFMKHDWWTNSDFVFMNSTCFSPSLMAEISTRAEKLKSGAIVVSLTKSITSKEFTIMSKEKHQMSFGSATVYVQKRI